MTDTSRNIGKYMANYEKMVEKSTVQVGTVDAVKAAVAGKSALRGLDTRYSVVSNPEFLKEGANIYDFIRHDRIIVGCEDEQTLFNMRTLYAAACYGGSCFPKDAKALIKTAATDAGISMTVLNAVELANHAQKHVLGNKVKARFRAELAGKHCAVRRGF